MRTDPFNLDDLCVCGHTRWEHHSGDPETSQTFIVCEGRRGACQCRKFQLAAAAVAESPENVYLGYFADGIEYCDLERAKQNDYHKIAYFSYRTRELVIHDKDSPLLGEIEAHADRYRQAA